MRRKKILLLLPLLVLLVLILVKIVSINQQYPQVEYHTIAAGAENELENGIYMKVLSTQVVESADAQQRYGSDFAQEMEAGYDYRTVEVEVEITNRSEIEQDVPLYEIYIENTSYSNGIAPEVFTKINKTENEDLRISLKKSESQKVKLGYALYKMQFSKTQWRTMDIENFFLACQRYPVKYRWKLRNLNC